MFSAKHRTWCLCNLHYSFDSSTVAWPKEKLEMEREVSERKRTLAREKKSIYLPNLLTLIKRIMNVKTCVCLWLFVPFAAMVSERYVCVYPHQNIIVGEEQKERKRNHGRVLMINPLVKLREMRDTTQLLSRSISSFSASFFLKCVFDPSKMAKYDKTHQRLQNISTTFDH